MFPFIILQTWEWGEGQNNNVNFVFARKLNTLQKRNVCSCLCQKPSRERVKTRIKKLSYNVLHIYFIFLRFFLCSCCWASQKNMKIKIPVPPWWDMMNECCSFYPLVVMCCIHFTWHTMRRSLSPLLPQLFLSKFISPWAKQVVCATKVAVRTAKKNLCRLGKIALE